MLSSCVPENSSEKLGVAQEECQDERQDGLVLNSHGMLLLHQNVRFAPFVQEQHSTDPRKRTTWDKMKGRDKK